jgi:hypothetical protein
MADAIYTEAQAERLVAAAGRDHRLAELLNELSAGGAATVDRDGSLAIATADDLAAMWGVATPAQDRSPSGE